MDEIMQPYGVYIKTDDSGRIVAINSDAFLSSLDGWVKIAEGWGDKHHHAQGNFLDKPIFADNGICRYKFEDGEVVERTAEEIDADYVEPAPPESNDTSALAAEVKALQEQVNKQSELLAAYEAAYTEGVQEA